MAKINKDSSLRSRIVRGSKDVYENTKLVGKMGATIGKRIIGRDKKPLDPRYWRP
jgi:hypothetical protein